jgi:hypothetical protein
LRSGRRRRIRCLIGLGQRPLRDQEVSCIITVADPSVLYDG